MRKIICLGLMAAMLQTADAQPIDRKAVVTRHAVANNTVDSLSSLTVGNGIFAFTVDVTGLQTFPELYAKGVPLGTQSEWGWHSWPNKEGLLFEETLRKYHFHDRDITYSVQVKEPERSKKAVNYFRENVHRLHLGNLGFELFKKDGQPAGISDITDIQQTLNMFTGEIHSRFKVDGVPVDVLTYGHQQQDAIAVKVSSPLVQQGRLAIRLHYPYPTGEWGDAGNSFEKTGMHQSSITAQTGSSAAIVHTLDTTTYYTYFKWKGNAEVSQKAAHYFVVKPVSGSSFEFSCRFTPKQQAEGAADFMATQQNSINQWAAFWKSGAMADFGACTDSRAKEIERRMVLSLYLTKAQCAGNFPPQETGLTYNSWYGKPHMEMHWWHSFHYALWGRPHILEKSMHWYDAAAEKAYALAKRQGYTGARWQKMTDHAGNESPSSVGALLIWQQPHFISFAELLYREKKDPKVLAKYKELVFATAEFMSSFAYFDTNKKKYILGKGVIPAQERFKAEETFNPTYELVYWHWALNVAQQWRQRLGMPRNKKWDEVVAQLSPLPVQDGLYLAAESATDSYTNPEYRTDHPSVFGALGMMPKTPQLDTAIMHKTFDWIWDNWSWKDTWGWDFPMTAMTATRLGLPEKAVESLLMPIQTNTYLINGHNYQDDRLRLYLPGNGGILTAIAMMCGGYDGSTVKTPGFPKNGKWNVKWEGFRKMP